MIVKIPIYVELSDIPQEHLQTIVNSIGHRMYLILRNEEIAYNSDLVGLPKEVKLKLKDAKVLSKEKAFEALRVTK